MRPEFAGVFSTTAIITDLLCVQPENLRRKLGSHGRLGLEDRCGTLLLRIAPARIAESNHEPLSFSLAASGDAGRNSGGGCARRRWTNPGCCSAGPIACADFRKGLGSSRHSSWAG